MTKNSSPLSRYLIVLKNSFKNHSYYINLTIAKLKLKMGLSPLKMLRVLSTNKNMMKQFSKLLFWTTKASYHAKQLKVNSQKIF
jgi:hypothetical protein